MVSKLLLAVCCVMAVATAVPTESAPGKWGPPALWGAGGWGPNGWGAGGWGAGVGGWGAGAGGGANPWIPPWIAAAPWFPQWAPCTTIGSVCVDCTTKAVCTKMGGIQRACTDPTMPYCNLGECSATPSAECAPPAVPAADAATGAV